VNDLDYELLLDGRDRIGSGAAFERTTAMTENQANCANCKFARQNAAALECHRYPSTVGFVPGSKGPLSFSAWSTVDPFQWCGEYKTKILVATNLDGI